MSGCTQLEARQEVKHSRGIEDQHCSTSQLVLPEMVKLCPAEGIDWAPAVEVRR